MLNVALLGCGRIAQRVHLPVLSRLEGVTVRAIAEVDPGRRAQAGERAATAAAYPDYRALLEDATTEAVVVCLPTSLHEEAAVAAFACGQHVYLEKPVATTVGSPPSAAQPPRNPRATVPTTNPR